MITQINELAIFFGPIFLAFSSESGKFALWNSAKVEYMMQEAKMQDNHSLAQMEFLYKKFYVRLHRYALTFLGDEDEATDVVGEVFLQIWES